MPHSMQRRDFMRGATLLLGAAVLALSLVRHAAAEPQPVDRPLNLTSTGGLFVTSLSGAEAAAVPSARKNEKKALKQANKWFAGVAGSQLAGAFPDVKTKRAQKLVNKLFTKLVNRQQLPAESPFEPQDVAPRLNVLALYTTFTVVGLTADEALDVTFDLDGVDYDASLSERTTQSVDGVSIQIDYTEAPANGSLDGSLFVAAVRESSLPSTGVLVIGVLDADLPALLEDLGATNQTQMGTALTLPFELELSGNVSGTHVAESPSFHVSYYALAGVLGAGVPPELESAALQLLNNLPVSR